MFFSRIGFDILIGHKLIALNLELKMYVFGMARAESNSDIYFTKAVLLFCVHGHFFLNIALLGVICPPPPNTIRVKKI